MESDTGNIPLPKLLPGTTILLLCTLVGDEAFPLKSYLMRPYPRKSLISDSQQIFNYRFFRARRTIENAFGIFVSRYTDTLFLTQHYYTKQKSFFNL